MVMCNFTGVGNTSEDVRAGNEMPSGKMRKGNVVGVRVVGMDGSHGWACGDLVGEVVR